jgi:hypothetical protein
VPPVRALVPAVLTAAVLWVGIGALSIAARPLPRTPSVLAGLVLPTTLPNAAWFAPGGGALGLALLAGALYAGVLALLLRLVLRDGEHRFVPAWFAVLVAGFIGTGAVAAALVLPEVGSSGAGYTASSIVQNAAPAGLWGLLYGWLPALLLARSRSTAPVDRRGARILPAAVLAVAAGAVLLLVAAPLVRQPVTPEAPPAAAPSPAPTAYGWDRIAPSPVASPAGTCAPSDVTLSLGTGDAATGHRALPVSVTNTGDAACVLDGYPDVVFDDAAGNAMDVLVVQGGSFMAQDAGARRVRLAPGDAAVATLGWNAQSAAGEQRAGRVYVSVRQGDPRIALPADLDVKDGGSVSLTAWARPGGAG